MLLNFINILKYPVSRNTQNSPQTLDLQELATVDEAILPGRTGRVRFMSSWWPARCERNIALTPGQKLQVVGHENITLLVEPIC